MGDMTTIEAKYQALSSRLDEAALRVWAAAEARNWRGRPLISREVVVNLIGSTTTTLGLFIKAVLDENTYAPGIKVSDEEIAVLVIARDEFHGEWNYRLRPRDQHG